jgi:3-mercaptopyruvate sulfurtransferase SseA
MKKRNRARKNASMMPMILIGAGALLVIAVLVLQIVQSPNPSTAGQDIPEPGVERVSLSQAKSAFDNKTAVFLDVRDAASYATSHIPGSVNIPYSEIETRLSELDPNQWIITYCT